MVDTAGQGAFGRVLRPAAQCHGESKDTSGMVSKIMKRGDAVKELAEYERVRQIDPQSLYYLGMPHMCPPQVTAYLLSESELNIKDMADMVLLQQKDGGMSLRHFFESPPPATFIIPNMLRQTVHLLEGIQLFRSHGLAHTDIKGENIVINPTTGQMRFIDFGLMTSFDEIQLHVRAGDATWLWNNPMEFIVPEHLDEPSKNQIMTSLEAFFWYAHISDKQTAWSFIETVHSSRAHFLQQYGGDAFLNQSIPTIDLFGYGMSMAALMRLSMIRAGTLSTSPYAELYQLFSEFIAPNLFVRYALLDDITRLIARVSDVVERTIGRIGSSKKRNGATTTSRRINGLQRKNGATRRHVTGGRRRCSMRLGSTWRCRWVMRCCR